MGSLFSTASSPLPGLTPTHLHLEQRPSEALKSAPQVKGVQATGDKQGCVPPLGTRQRHRTVLLPTPTPAWGLWVFFFFNCLLI